MLLLAARLKWIVWDVSQSFSLRLAITVFTIVLLYSVGQVNVVNTNVFLNFCIYTYLHRNWGTILSFFNFEHFYKHSYFSLSLHVYPINRATQISRQNPQRQPWDPSQLSIMDTKMGISCEVASAIQILSMDIILLSKIAVIGNVHYLNI